MKKQLRRNEPRFLRHRHGWYYVNAGSVDLMVSSGSDGPPKTVLGMRLKRRVLQAMLAELRPIRKRK